MSRTGISPALTARGYSLPLSEVQGLRTARHLGRVGKDCLLSFEASMCSVPASRIRAAVQRVELRVTPPWLPSTP